MTSYPCNKYEQITPSYRLSVKYILIPQYLDYFVLTWVVLFLSLGMMALLNYQSTKPFFLTFFPVVVSMVIQKVMSKGGLELVVESMYQVN